MRTAISLWSQLDRGYADRSVMLNCPMGPILGAANIAIFVVPPAWRIVDNILKQRSRSFSHIVDLRQLAIGLLARIALAAMGTGFSLAILLGEPDTPMWIHFCVHGVFLVLGLGLMLFNRTDYRLQVDGDTGFITWTKISVPWPHTRPKVAFIDGAGLLHYDDGTLNDMTLFTLTRLERYYTYTHNNNHGSRGHFRSKALLRMCDLYNEYREAFFRHDTPEARDLREKARQQHERSLQPRRHRKAREAQLEQEEKRADLVKRQAQEANAKQERERKRRQRLDERFK